MVTKSVELYTAAVTIEGWQKSRQANYTYILLEGEKEIECSRGNMRLPCYGVEIRREYMDGDGQEAVCSDRIESMTTSRYKVIQLIKTLYENCVSPIHLVDIAGSSADEWVSDFDDKMNKLQAQ